MAEDIQSNIRINVDTAAALANIKNLQSQLSAFYTQMSKSGAAANAVAANMQQNFINSVNMSGKFAASVQTIKSTTESFTESLEKNKFSIGEYFRYAGAASKSFGKLFKTEFDTIDRVAQERVKSLQTQYIKLGRDANGALKAIAVRPLTLDLENLSTKTQIAAQKQQLLNQLLKQGSTQLLNWGKNTQWAGRQLMVGFTIPLLAAGSAAAKAYQQIEQASIQIRRVYGDLNTSAQETNAMVKQIQTLAAEYTKFGVAVSDTMSMAAQAAAMGKTGNDLLAQVENATKLSVLGGVDQQKALETTTSLTNAFGITTAQLSDKINYLNAVENQTILNIEDMTTAIPKAAPVVKQLGGSVEDLAYFMTAMREGGISASQGANALKSGLASIINPSKQASDFLQTFGINVAGIVQQDKGNLRKTVLDFASALNTLDPLNRARAIEMMFGKFQFSRMSTLFQNITKDGSQAQKAMELANMSSIQRAALARKEMDKIQSSPLYKFQKAMADMQLKLAPVGEAFMKAVTPIINFVSKILEGFNNMGDGAKSFVIGTISIIGGLAPVLLMIVGLVANGAANLMKFFAGLKNFFNKTTTASEVLGETTNYMTREQIKAAAVAASLDQVHSKLKQTFTAEAAAVDLYTSALERANAAAALHQGPGMAFRALVKKADGGIISGPGTGTSDSIPAMVSNGEAIIPAKNVAKFPQLVNALVSGRLPGFKDGKDSSQFAHVNENSVMISAGDLFDKIIAAELAGQKIPLKLKNHIAGIVADIGRNFQVRGYSGLGFSQDRLLNVGMRQGGSVNTDAFLNDFESRGLSKWKKSIKLGGGNFKDEELQKHLQDYDSAIIANIKEFKKLSNGATITSDQFAEIEKQARLSIPEFSQLRKALDSAESGLFEVRSNLTQSMLKKAGMTLERLPSATGTGFSEKYTARFSTGTYVRTGGNRIYKESAGSLLNLQMNDFANAAAVEAQTASPSKKTKKVAKDTVDGYVKGLEEGKARVKKISDELRTITQSMADSERRLFAQRIAAVGDDQEAIAIITKEAQAREKEIQATKAQIAADSALAAERIANSLPTPTRNLRYNEQGPLLPGQRRMGRIESALKAPIGELASGASTGKLAGLGMAASMATFALASMPGPLGQFANSMLPLVNILGLVTPLFGVFKTALMGIGLSLGEVLLPIAGLALAIGGITMLVNAENDARKKELAKINAKANVYSGYEKSKSEISSLLGVSLMASASETAARNRGVSLNAKQASDVATLLDSDAFTNKDSQINQTMVANLKPLSQNQAKLYLSSLANTLKAQGAKADVINSFIKALQIKAGQTSFKLDFANIDLSSKNGRQSLINGLTTEASKAAATYGNLFKKVGTQYYTTSKSGLANTADLVTYTKQDFAKDLANNADYAAQIKQIGENAGSAMDSLITQLQHGAISSKNFGSGLDAIKQGLAGMSPVQLTGMFASFGATAMTTAGDLGTLNQQMAYYIALATNSDKAQQIQELAAKLKTVTGRGKTLVARQIEDISKQILSSVNFDAITKNSGFTPVGSGAGTAASNAYKDLRTQLLDMRKSVGAELALRKQLVKAGLDQATAEKLAADSTAQQAWLTAKTAKEKANVISWLKQENALQDKLISKEQKAINAQQKVVDLLQAQRDLKANELGMDVMQQQITQYQDALNVLSIQEADINNTYNDRIKALDEIQKANQAVADTQKDQLTIADAITKGDIAAAAKAAQDARNNAAKRAMDDQKSALDTAKQNQLDALTVSINGKLLTRKQIEKEIEGIQARIYDIQLNTLDPMDSQIAKAKELLSIYQNQQSIANNGGLTNITAPEAAPTLGIKSGQLFQYIRGGGSKINGTANVALSSGGMVPSYFANGGYSRGTDVVPAMLTPGEFIMSRGAVQNLGLGVMDKINSGNFNLPSYSIPGSVSKVSSSANSSNIDNSSVYNSYTINVNAGNAGNPDAVARVVLDKIRQLDSQNIRGVRA